MAAIDALNGSAHYAGAKHPIKVLVGHLTLFFFIHDFSHFVERLHASLFLLRVRARVTRVWNGL